MSSDVVEATLEAEIFAHEQSPKKYMAVGLVLYAAGVDLSELHPKVCDELTVRKLVDMCMDENYRRWRLLRETIGDLAVGVIDDWHMVKAAKSSRAKGPLGTVVHYLTHLNSEMDSGC